HAEEVQQALNKATHRLLQLHLPSKLTIRPLYLEVKWKSPKRPAVAWTTAVSARFRRRAREAPAACTGRRADPYRCRRAGPPYPSRSTSRGRRLGRNGTRCGVADTSRVRPSG